MKVVKDSVQCRFSLNRYYYCMDEIIRMIKRGDLVVIRKNDLCFRVLKGDDLYFLDNKVNDPIPEDTFAVLVPIENIEEIDVAYNEHSGLYENVAKLKNGKTLFIKLH